MPAKKDNKPNTSISAPPLADKQAVAAGSVPSQWPGGFGLYKYSAEAVKKVILPLVVIYVIYAVATILIDSLTRDTIGNQLSSIVGLILALPFAITYLAGVRGKSVTVSEAFSHPLELYLKLIANQIVVTFIVIASIIALIVPFFFIAPRLALAGYFQADNPEMDPIQAIKASWNQTNGHVGKVYGIVGVNILMALLCITIIGIPVAIYLLVMYSAAFAVLYRYITKR
jgi:hypothetical protein